MLVFNRQCPSHFVTSESVAQGHPDKVSDRISDEILDHFLSVSPEAHVAVEVLVTRDHVVVAGEICNVTVDKDVIELIVRRTIKDIGYEIDGFHWANVNVIVLLQKQSPDIFMGVVRGDNSKGAGDQGVMYGYATDETDSLLPAPIFYAHQILKNITIALQRGEISGLGPDAKTEITVLYENFRPVRVLRAVLSIQHEEKMTQKDVREVVYPIFTSSLPDGWMCKNEDFLVNPTGRFVIGGPVGDTGVTGRKIMVDTYGGHIPHGGGAFSGKDPSKVDRSAAYMARYIAKNVVHSGLANECLVQLSYGIGVSSPLTFGINTFGTNNVDSRKIEKFIRENIDLSCAGIVEYLGLKQQIYSSTSCYGHFGRMSEKSFSWEQLGLSFLLRREFNAIGLSRMPEDLSFSPLNTTP